MIYHKGDMHGNNTLCINIYYFVIYCHMSIICSCLSYALDSCGGNNDVYDDDEDNK